MNMSIERAIEIMSGMISDVNYVRAEHWSDMCEIDKHFLEEKEALANICLTALGRMASEPNI